MSYFNSTPTLAQQFFPSQNPQIDRTQFASVAATLDDNSLNKLVNLARCRGISEQDISAGLGFIKGFRK